MNPGVILPTEARLLLFVESSARCSLACDYCINAARPMTGPSMSLADLEFLAGLAGGGRVLLGLSGKGDFFSGYRPSDRVLDRLLDHDVEVLLDINGVVVHELPELPDEKLRRIRFVNLTLHHRELARKGLLATWTRNALRLLERRARHDLFVINSVVLPGDYAGWEATIRFFADAIHAPTGARLALLTDLRRRFRPYDLLRLKALSARFPGVVESVTREDYTGTFGGAASVLCPAGHTAFMVRDDGTIHGCHYVPELAGSFGNVFERRFSPRAEDFDCAACTYCECAYFAMMGRVRRREADRWVLAEPVLQPFFREARVAGGATAGTGTR